MRARFLLTLLGLGRRRAPAPPEAPATPEFVERRREPRQPVFQEAQLTLTDYHKVRAVIVDLSTRGARVRFDARMDLPFRIRLSAPLLNLNCWARVVWQDEGVAGLEFQEGT